MNIENHKNRVIPSAGPSITDKEVAMVAEAVKYGWYENMNKHIDQFTEEFTSYIGMKYCLPTCNCTSAIHLALLGLGIGPGDEVIVPDITWVASAAPIRYVGATPVFADIDRKSWCLSPESFEKLITHKTKAVMPVDLLGNMPNMKKIMDIAKHHKIKVIEDAAEGIGAEYKGKKAGTFGDIGVFSFNATKYVAAGQGGMLATNNKDVYERCKLLSHHGISKKPNARYYWSNVIGYNYQWTNMQAALALVQLRRINDLIAKKKWMYELYRESLKNIEGLQFNSEEKHIKNTFWIITAIISKKYGLKKETIINQSKKFNMDIRPFFYPLSSMPAYAQYCKSKNMRKTNPVSYEISPYGICLPSAMSISESDVEHVCDSLKTILTKR